jgi:hypothetical protein
VRCVCVCVCVCVCRSSFESLARYVNSPCYSGFFGDFRPQAEEFEKIATYTTEAIPNIVPSPLNFLMRDPS